MDTHSVLTGCIREMTDEIKHLSGTIKEDQKQLASYQSQIAALEHKVSVIKRKIHNNETKLVTTRKMLADAQSGYERILESTSTLIHIIRSKRDVEALSAMQRSSGREQTFASAE